MMDLSRPEPQDADLARCYVVQGQDFLISLASASDWQFPHLEARPLREHHACHFLGLLHDVPCYVCRFEDFPANIGELVALPLRQLLGSMDEIEFAMASRALQYLSWQNNHRFCSHCGAQTRHQPGELAMLCDACGYTQYPRITPCVIGLVTRGDYCLLGRSARFPDGMYSCLAGFMEAGETAEQALVREVMEESGVAIDNLRYIRSQSWPFPHSLMLGFHADYAAGEICIDDDEIVAADWFHYRDLPMIPPQGSIARMLIDHWLARFE